MDDASDSKDTSPQAPMQRPMRKRALKGAYAAFNNEFSDVPCTLRDESETGAKLEFENGWWVPDRFTLFVEIDGYKVECEKVWHKGKIYGVQFTGPKETIATQRRQKVDFSSIQASEPMPETARPDERAKPVSRATARQHRPAFGKLGKQN